jgi:hypothetical protein
MCVFLCVCLSFCLIPFFSLRSSRFMTTLKGMLWRVVEYRQPPPTSTLSALHGNLICTSFSGRNGNWMCVGETRGEGGTFHTEIYYKRRTSLSTSTHIHPPLYFLYNPPGGTNSQTLLLLYRCVFSVSPHVVSHIRQQTSPRSVARCQLLFFGLWTWLPRAETYPYLGHTY